ncbi:MAG: MFS transporter [Candidatus Eremiobacteraeota bacterium]|nr:MFS transporter [Candidatus Eremiobacteraeota bacterium]MBC5802146.1 MFS transporter [Candidatus Eremiobacteraeota bacterium]MBC5821727.1 MFS transporter [Candidatus Eremiobacteraeota bacterium]
MAYAVLVVSALFFEIAMNLPVGTMPLALTADGASRAATSVAMGSGMFAALLASLPLGALTDRFGRLVMIRAAAVLGIAALGALSFAHGPLAGGLLLGVRSIALVAYMTAEFAYASELASNDRAVSGVATLGMIGNLTFALAPAASVFLWQHGIGRQQYAWATGVAALGAACLFLLPKRYDVRTAHQRTVVLDRRWLPACFFAAATVLQGGVNGSIAVLTFADRGIVNGAAIFSASALTAFALRYPAGRLVDRFGPRLIALPTAAIQVVGCALAAQAHSLVAVIVAGACLGTAWAAVVPVSIGLLFEHSKSETRGAAMGAYNLAFSGGAACGALLATGATLAGPGYPLAITLCALAPLAVLPYVWRSGSNARRMPRVNAGAAVGQ